MPTSSLPLVTGPSSDVRRIVPYRGQAGATSLKVPLETAPQGDVLEGRFAVPARLANTAPHTNDRMEFERVVKAAYTRWTEWRKRRGWDVVPGTLRLQGPFEQPVARTGDEGDEEQRLFIFTARFTRETPVYIGLDDFLAVREMANTYGIDTSKEALPWDTLKGGDSGWVNPMEYAEARRKALGLKREDFLLGPLEEPL